MNETYRRKAGKSSRYDIGDHVEIEDTYHLESWVLMKKVVRDLTSAALGRLSK